MARSLMVKIRRMIPPLDCFVALLLAMTTQYGVIASGAKQSLRSNSRVPSVWLAPLGARDPFTMRFAPAQPESNREGDSQNSCMKTELQQVYHQTAPHTLSVASRPVQNDITNWLI